MIIREYKASDKPALVELTLLAWEPVFQGMQTAYNPEIYEVFVPDWRKEQLRSINSTCDSDDVQVIVAEQDETILGFSSVTLHPEDFLGAIHMMAVDPRHRRKGVGTQLIDASLEIIKRNGFELAMVETGGDPGHAAARKAYEKSGFERVPVARYLMRL